MANEQYLDINLSQSGRKSIRIDGDDNRILQLDTSDLSIISRLKQAETQIEGFVREAAEKLLKSDGSIDTVSDTIMETDANMRACIDYIFNSNVSEVCAPQGTMFDPFNGKYRFEIIMEALSNLYGSQLSIEYRKLASRIKTRTSKYTGN